VFVLFGSAAMLVSALSSCTVLLTSLRFLTMDDEKLIECKKISRYLRHESSHVLGQQLQIIFVEENIGRDERRRYVEFHNFIHFVS
jgi:hypothetical protein